MVVKQEQSAVVKTMDLRKELKIRKRDGSWEYKKVPANLPKQFGDFVLRWTDGSLGPETVPYYLEL